MLTTVNGERETKRVKKLCSERQGDSSQTCRGGGEIPRRANGTILARLSSERAFGTFTAKSTRKYHFIPQSGISAAASICIIFCLIV